MLTNQHNLSKPRSHLMNSSTKNGMSKLELSPVFFNLHSEHEDILSFVIIFFNPVISVRDHTLVLKRELRY